MPYDGYPKFVQQEYNDNWGPIWLQAEGYQACYTGKLMNIQNIVNYSKPFPKGFTGSDFLLDLITYNYMNTIFQRNKEPPMFHKHEYSTDLICEKVLAFLDDAIEKPDSPFFIAVAPITPHSDYTLDINIGGDPPVGVDIFPPVSSPKYEDLFPDAIVPRGPSFNPDTLLGVDWIAELPKLPVQNILFLSPPVDDHLSYTMRSKFVAMM